jgi:hypothetical protein
VRRDDFNVLDPAPAVAVVVFDPHIREMHLVVVVRQAVLSRPPGHLLVFAGGPSVTVWSVAIALLQELLVLALQLVVEHHPMDVRAVIPEALRGATIGPIDRGVVRQLARLLEPGVKSLPGLIHIVSASRLEHVPPFTSEDHDVTVSAAERHRLHQALVAQVTQATFVGDVSQILDPGNAEGADRGQRPTLRSVQFVGSIPHQDELTFVPLGKVEAARDRFSRSVGAVLAFARVIVAGTSAATQVRASVITFTIRNVEVSWIPHGGTFTRLAWGPRA